MKKLFLLLSLISFMFVGCDTQTGDETKFTILSKLPVSVGYAGGEVIVNFKITNPNPDNLLTCVSPTEWISEPLIKESGIIVFEVSRNTTEYPRETVIKILYGSDIIDIPVEQSARAKDQYDYNIEATVFGGEYYGRKIYTNYNYFVQLGNGVINENNDTPNAIYYYFDLYANRRGGDHPILPNGTYTIDNTMTDNDLDPVPGKYSRLYSKVCINDEDGNPMTELQVVAGKVVVTDNKFEAEVEMSDGSVHHVVYEGELYVPYAIDDTPKRPYTFLTENYTFNHTEGIVRLFYYGDTTLNCGLDHWSVHLMECIEPINGDYITIDIITEPGTNAMDSIIGTYTAGSDLDPKAGNFIPGIMESWKYFFSWRRICEDDYIINGKGRSPLVGGTIKIEKEGNGYLVTMDCVDDGNFTLKGTFSCPVVEYYERRY